MLDYIIIGAGIAGAGMAAELSGHADLLLLEAEERPGYHATGRSAALFATSYGGPIVRALTRASSAFFAEPGSDYGEYPLLTDRGVLYIARSDQLASLEATMAKLRATGSEIEFLPAEEACRRIPLLRPEYVAACAFEPAAKDVDVDALHQGFLRRARRNGTQIVTGVRDFAVRRENGAWALAIDGEWRRTRIVINAAGAWADEVAAWFGAAPIGLQPLRRSAAIVVPSATIDSELPAIVDIDECFYMKPDAGLLLISPADEQPSDPCDAYADDLDIAIGIDRVQQAVDLDIQRVVRSWAGLRTFARDREPVIGFDPEVEDFFWCAGQGGYGIQTAPAAARLAAALALRRDIPADLVREGIGAEMVSPARFTCLDTETNTLQSIVPHPQSINQEV
jgi:D-arginine dehydrogenase